jgi:hypothetical protein
VRPGHGKNPVVHGLFGFRISAFFRVSGFGLRISRAEVPGLTLQRRAVRFWT